MSPTLTAHLLTRHTPLFTRATQSAFLSHAALGTLPRSTIAHWLANDRLYMQGYIRLSGTLLRLLRLPAHPVPCGSAGGVETRLLDWLVAALGNIRREERWFVRVAEGYALGIDISREGEVEEDGVRVRVVDEERKSAGLKRFERLFGRLTSCGFEEQSARRRMPWLEGVVVFWATERVYLEAWRWARNRAAAVEREEGRGSEDLDGGAMRKEFIPNWTSEEFGRFVGDLESILNDAVEEVCGADEGVRREVYSRAEGVWKELLECEVAFWPEVEG
ncbi:heme oxygenase-like protein [Lophiostoma macrostomum CBS 122681]|uniref:Heme oxygenase-like protein n=1 Tax=Lophiostoma macrostomum CBS 122681 TaxID=1314788 RepID=A0A6A6TK29_9PLEO|nr:heme oxygenase-like protein [Lophiostoma macrostomum CBS 122681]